MDLSTAFAFPFRLKSGYCGCPPANLVYDEYFVQYDVIRELMLFCSDLTREYVDLTERKQVVKLHKPKRLIICS